MMTREDAIRSLSARSSRERLDGAKYFVAHGTIEDVALLRRARHSEADAYVQKRLEQAIEVLTGPEEASASVDDARLSDDFDQLVSRAEQWVGGLLLHEMEGPIGRASLYASLETANYEVSKTRIEIETIRSIFSGIEQLVRASHPPRPQEIDLAKLIDDAIASEVGSSIEVSRVGTQPLLVTVDADLLRLALANGLRNAREAIQLVAPTDQLHQIVVTWGQTDRDYWISIIDDGAGISGSSSTKFEIGTSTKAGHRGFGLAVARRAMKGIGGDVSLSSKNSGGARYQLRWPRR
jgi:signal transduction histidine kinase